MEIKKKHKQTKAIKCVPHKEEYWTEFESSAHDLAQAQQRNIVYELFNHVREPKVYTIEGICGILDVSITTWKRYLAKYSIIKEANERAKAYLAAKRFNAAASKEASEKLLNWAGQYSEDHMEYIKFLSAINKDSNQQKFTTVMLVETEAAIPTDVKQFGTPTIEKIDESDRSSENNPESI